MSKNGHFSKGVNPWLGSKNGHLSKFFFLGNIGQENVFYDIPERKKSLSRLSKQKVQKVENGHFFKGVTLGLCPKMAIFPTFFLRNIGQENVFYDILELKYAFLGYRNKNFKKLKN